MYRLPDTLKPLDFPDDFETSPEGLLALGGNLHPQTLVNAYAKGIFPWFGPEDPLLWWHTDPRLVLYPQEIYVSRSLRQVQTKLRNDHEMDVVFNRDFKAVMQACAAPRAGQPGTWITEEMLAAYCELHAQGYAHSVEVWQNDVLVAGLYGIALGKVFFGESMFTTKPNLSKIALMHLCETLQTKDFVLIDCQQETAHLQSLGAKAVSRAVFLQELERAGCKDKSKTIF